MLPITIHGFVTEGVCQAVCRLARFFSLGLLQECGC
jgi:hypothetical protein